MAKLDAHDIIRTIAESKKKTPVKVYVKGDLNSLDVPSNVETYFTDNVGVMFGDWADVEPILKDSSVESYHLENDGRNTGVAMVDINKDYNEKTLEELEDIVYNAMMDNLDEKQDFTPLAEEYEKILDIIVDIENNL